MATIDRLDIQIEGSAQKANVAINDLIKNLDRLANSLKIDTSGLEKIGKSLNLSGIDKAAKNMQSQTQKVSKSLSQITEQYKDLGKGFEIKGSTQQIQKQIDSLTNKLANAKLAKDDFEASGKANLGGYETAVKNVIKYTNQIESLKKQLEGLQTAQPKLDFNVAGAESQTKYLVEYKKQLIDFKNDMKSIGDVYGGLQNVPKGGLDTLIQNLKQSIEELKQSYPQATNVISAFEKELQKLQGISSGLTKEPIRANIDTSSIDKVSEKIAELKNRFEKVGSDFKFTGNFEQLNIEIEKVYSKLNELRTKEQEMISAGQVNTSGFEQLQESLARVGNKFGIMQDLRDRTEAFNQSLQQLRVPEIREENLTKLQNSLRKTEADTEKLRTKLSNAITMGRIVPNIDDSGFRKLTEQIALSEKQAEALRQKIQEVGGDTSGTGSIMDRLKSSLSNVSSQSSKTSSATNILSKNIKNLSSTMSGFSKSAGKAVTGLKSFARQALSAMGIYLGVYGAVRGLKSSLESSMNYIEILNYFNAAFGQVAEKADYSKFEEMGYDSAEAYYNSFSERAKELTEKMSGFTMNESGMLESGGMKSLGIDPTKLMNYQAMFGQMSSSMGATSENALRLSTVLTEIGADLASVKNMKFEKVWNDMASGLAGMSRTLDKYGANIRNVNLQQKLNELGISANISALNQNDKALLRTIILLDSTRYAWGDLAKTINQPANQLRLLQSNFSNLGRAIGNIFLPIVAKVLPYINMLVQALTRLAEWLVKLLGFEGFDWGGGGGGNSTPDILGDIYDNAEDASGALDKVSESAKKAKAGLRGFDELKTINMPESNEPDDGAGGAGTGGIDSGLLQGALDSILDEYQAAWDKAFSEMENRANTFADNVAKAFKEKGLYGVGEYFSKSITSALESIPWDSVYEGARMFGSGLASFLNGLISPDLFGALGKTIAGALNTALHFLDSFGETFDFTNFGVSIGAGINSALGGIDWKTALSAAKKWGTGIGNAINGFFRKTDFSTVGSTLANALNTAIQLALSSGKKIDFELIGKKISDGINGFFKTFRADKLAKAINVWMKGALKTVSTLLKKTDFDMIGKKIGKFLAELDLTGALKGLASVVWEAIKGAFNLLSGIFKSAPIEASLLVAFSFLKFTKVGQIFTSNLFSILKGGATQSLNKFASFFNGGLLGVIGTAVAAFAEFSVVSDSIENLTLGTGDFIAEIGKIAGVVGIAWAGMSAILGFPAGTIATAIVGIVGAIKGISDAFKDIKAESAMQSIANALKKPGGTPIEDLTELYSDTIGKIKSGFDDINVKSEELKTTQTNAEKTSKKIDLIKFSIENGSKATKEKTTEIKQAFDSLLSDSKSIFEQEYDVIMTGISGSLQQSLTDAGYSVEQIVGVMDSLKTEHQKEIEEIEKNNEKLKTSFENGKISIQEYAAKMLENYEKLGEITGKTDEYSSAIEKVSEAAKGVDLSGIVNKDNTINTGLLAEQFKGLSTTATEAKQSINDSSAGLTAALNDYAKEAERTKNSEAATAISDMLSAEEANVKSATESVNNQLTEYGNQVQYAVLEKIPSVVDEAVADYENKSPIYKFFNSEESHVQSALEEYQKNVIDPSTEELERLYSEAGIEGATFSSNAGKEIIDAMFDENIVSSGELTYYSKTLKSNYTKVVNNAVDEIKKDAKKKSKQIGKNIDEGTRDGVNENLGLATGAIGGMANQMLRKARETLGVHSPSTKFKEIGGYVVEGMKGGISGKWGEFSEFWAKKHDYIINKFNGIKEKFGTKGKDIISGIRSGISDKWNDFSTFWGEKKSSIIDKFNDIKEKFNTKGGNIISGIRSGISGKWGEFNSYWTERKNSIVEKFKNIKESFQGKGGDIISGLKSGISSNWDGFVGWWAEKIKAMVNGILDGINWVLKKVGSSTQLDPWEPKGFAKGANGLPQDTIGIVNDQKGSTYKELIVPPHGKPFIPEGRNVMLPMKKGTKIMPARQTKDFMEKMNNMPHFAGGIGDFFKGAWAKISEFTGNIWDYISNPGKILQIAFDKFTDLSGMLEPVLSIATGAAKTLLDGATGFIKKMFDENLTVQYNPSQGVEQWRGLATKALQITNQFTAPNLTALLTQMQHESSGNPKAINLWDSNAKKGTPSKGLMQVIDPTFRAYALAPHNKDIWDPLSNMIAAIRYTVSHYGSLYSGWTARGYKGYASGIGKINLADLIPKYRAGGFPEDGLFYANHTELVGRFSNGQTAVANNGQITQGIAEAIYPAVYNAVSSAMRNNGTSGSVDISLQLNLDGDAVYKNVVKRTREGRDRNIGGRLVLAEEVY